LDALNPLLPDYYPEADHMISLLTRFFIKNANEYQNPKVRQAYGMLCGGVGIFLNLGLFLLKFVTGTVSNSISITADAFNNLSDAGSSLISLIGFKLAGQKPDSEHPFGHGRIEYLSGFFVSVAILFMAYELIVTSIKKIIHPETIMASPLILYILLLSIAVKLYMSAYNRSIGRKLDSAAMLATSTDSLSDTISTFAVLLSTIFTMVTHVNIDGWCGVIVSLFIFYAGFDAAKSTISPLLGQPPKREFVEQIEQITLSGEHILGLHDLVVHDYGPGRVMISLHAEVPANGSLLELHDEIDMLEHKLKEELHCEAVIHMDPVMNDDPETIAVKQTVCSIVETYDKKLSIHDFRIVKRNSCSRIVFDLLIPVDYKISDVELIQTMTRLVNSQNPDYDCEIEIDRAYF